MDFLIAKWADKPEVCLIRKYRSRSPQKGTFVILPRNDLHAAPLEAVDYDEEDQEQNEFCVQYIPMDKKVTVRT